MPQPQANAADAAGHGGDDGQEQPASLNAWSVSRRQLHHSLLHLFFYPASGIRGREGF